MQSVQLCEFCRRGRLRFSGTALRIREETDCGWVDCEVVVQVGRCDHCGFAVLDESADGAIDAAVQQAYACLKPD